MFFSVSQYDRPLQSTWNVERYQLIGRFVFGLFEDIHRKHGGCVSINHHRLEFAVLGDQWVTVVLEAVDFVLHPVDLLS